jgi:3-hydroxy-9,10-secoandrosta-1,3,5(10)-triene-9,17-dione monooxygenase reductase component
MGVEKSDGNSYDMIMDTAPGSATSSLAVATIEPQVFRRVLGQFLTGVAVISAMDGEEPVGLTVGSFFSVSLDPPLVGFCAALSSKTWPVVRKSGRFCVNVLAADQEGVCRSFARTGTDKFQGVSWALSDGGCPRLDDVIAWIECDIEAVHGAGDHEICIGRVRALGDPRRSVPLPFFRGRHQINLPQ